MHYELGICFDLMARLQHYLLVLELVEVGEAECEEFDDYEVQHQHEEVDDDAVEAEQADEYYGYVQNR